MPEAGGPTTQSGIGYQNAIAALYLGRMCDTRDRPPRERVRAVRVEAPVAVDDIEIQFGDGSTGWVQAKERVDSSKPEWVKLWRDFAIARWEEPFGETDRIFLWLGEPSSNQRILKEICVRARRATTSKEWENSLNLAHQKVTSAIFKFLPSGKQDLAKGFELFASLHVELYPYEAIGRDLAPNWLPRIESTTTRTGYLPHPKQK